MNLTKQNWPLGWRPDFDAVNGDPVGLLRMDNLRIDKTGVIGLIDGQKRISASFSDYIENIYTKIIEGREYIWVSTGLTGTTVSRNNQTFSSGVSLAVSGAGSPTNRGVFGSAFNYILALAGKMRTKDPVRSAPIPLGLLTPVRTADDLGNSGFFGPSGIANQPGTLTIPVPTQAVVSEAGTDPGSIVIHPDDPNTLVGTLVSTPLFELDTTEIGIKGVRTRTANDIIQFAMTVQDQPATILDSVELDFILGGTPTESDSYEDFYYFVFDSSTFSTGPNTRLVLSAKRGQFSRYGNNQDLDWRSVIGVRIIVTAKPPDPTLVPPVILGAVTIKFEDIVFSGGLGGQLNGTYQYIQINVSDNGYYQAKSPVSPPSESFTLINGSVLLTAIQNDPNANEYWFFRKSVADLGIDPTTGESLNPSSLNQWYFVGKCFPIGSDHPVSQQGVFLDTLGDLDILELNADGSLLPNLFLQTLRSDDLLNPLIDDIFGMEGLFNERMLYMGASQVFLSDRLNPDAIDVRFTLKPSGDPTETNLWLKKLTNNVLILATSKTLYEISGKLLESPDGSIDIHIIDLGEAHPPISKDACNFEGALYYIAVDGLRATSGSNSKNVSPQLRHLFGDARLNSYLLDNINLVSTRHGVPGVAIYQGNSYSITACHNRIYFALPMRDGTRRLFYYDLVTQTYGLMYTDPITLHASQSGELLAGYASGAANTLFILDYNAGLGIDDGTTTAGLPFKLRTVFDPNGQPRNRKDTFTLKLIFDSGGSEISVDIQKDGLGVTETDEPSWTNLGRYSASGQSTVYIPLSAPAVTLGFRYSIQLSDVAGVKSFKLYEITIEYEPRPEQLDYLRILPTNMGTVSRKRWTKYAFVIDTLDNPIVFRPYLDNVAWSASGVVRTGTKLTYIFYFDSEAIATDMGGILTGQAASETSGANGVFEFYGVNLEECVSEKLPTPTTYLIIPPNDYGVPNRKRHTSYKFQIITRNGRVRYTPWLDGVLWTPSVYNTGSRKTTVEHFFAPNDVVGIDIGGILESIEDPKQPFEFYGTIVPQSVEKLPDRLTYLRIPTTNFGVPSRKRVRTLPMSIDTYGSNVNFYPIVDNRIIEPYSTFNTPNRQTVYHYFVEDVFGTDFGGILSCGGVGRWLRTNEGTGLYWPE